MAPLFFPAHSVIAVGDPGSQQAGGSTLDFVCNSDFRIKRVKSTEAVETDEGILTKNTATETAANPWEPAIAAVGITALVLIRAMTKGLGKLFCPSCRNNVILF